MFLPTTANPDKLVIEAFTVTDALPSPRANRTAIEHQADIVHFRAETKCCLKESPQVIKGVLPFFFASVQQRTAMRLHF